MWRAKEKGVARRSVGLETMYRWRRGRRRSLSLACRSRGIGLRAVGAGLVVMMQVLLVVGRGLLHGRQHAGRRRRLGSVVALVQEIEIQWVG